MSKQRKHNLLLTPGPLTTSTSVKAAMLADWGSRDTEFTEMTLRVRGLLGKIIVGSSGDSYTTLLIQGSGTFALEAAITTLVPRQGKVLVLVNGAYGRRLCKICEYHSRSYHLYETRENEVPVTTEIEAIIDSDEDISHIAMVHCETTSGIINPLEQVAKIALKKGKFLIVDAMSSFGALPINTSDLGQNAIVASSNKCLEGVPGIGFVIVEKKVIEKAKGNANSLSLDLHDQWSYFEQTGEWRFTPPTQVLAALNCALEEHQAEGGQSARLFRYSENHSLLVDGMKKLGFKTFLPDNLQSPIIVTFKLLQHPDFSFTVFYNMLKEEGYTIYPGKLTINDSFRVGCIGHVNKDKMRGFLVSVEKVLGEMGVRA